MYTAALGATVIIFIILGGVKPLERRFISLKQPRNIALLVDRGSVSLDGVHNALGTTPQKESAVIAMGIAVAARSVLCRACVCETPREIKAASSHQTQCGVC